MAEAEDMALHDAATPGIRGFADHPFPSSTHSPSTFPLHDRPIPQWEPPSSVIHGGGAAGPQDRHHEPQEEESNEEAVIGGVSLRKVLPGWLVTTLQHASRWLFWPFVGGVMYGIGEVTARELLARRYHWGEAPTEVEAKAAAAAMAMEKARPATLRHTPPQGPTTNDDDDNDKSTRIYPSPTPSRSSVPNAC